MLLTAGSGIAIYVPTIEGKRIWSFVSKLDTNAPDRDIRRLGAPARLSIRADGVHRKAAKQLTIGSASYGSTQSALYKASLKLVSTGPIRDSDD
jgi:hypothetical protein